MLLDGLEDPSAVSLEGWPTEPPDDAEGELIELAVSYDGPDLESVAAHCDLEVDEVVRRHREAVCAQLRPGDEITLRVV